MSKITHDLNEVVAKAATALTAVEKQLKQTLQKRTA
jgi:hypothetical protein